MVKWQQSDTGPLGCFYNQTYANVHLAPPLNDATDLESKVQFK